MITWTSRTPEISERLHYVYMIESLVDGKFYIGARTCAGDPKKDLGIKYFSSSTNKNFIAEQKENPSGFVYSILDVFGDREEALRLEIALHDLYDVGRNPAFYNKAKQTFVGFDSTGVTQSEETKAKRGAALKGYITVKDKTGKLFAVRRSDPRWVSGEVVAKNKGRVLSEGEKKRLRGIWKGRKHSPETLAKMSASRKGKAVPEEFKVKLRASCKHKKAVSVCGNIYASLNEAAKEAGVPRTTLRRMCISAAFHDHRFLGKKDD